MRQAIVRVAEMEAAVVYNVGNRSFSRFLTPGHHWLVPFVERVEATISTAPQSVTDRCQDVQTSGGLGLTVEWTLFYRLNPCRVAADARPRLARALPRKAPAMVKKQVDNCLRHIIGEYTIDDLCQPRALKRLERQVRQLATARLAPLGFEVSRAMVGAIDMPAHIQAALATAHERRMQAENEAKALAHLQKVVSQFSEADMQRLIELERIHVLGQNGVALFYPAVLERETAMSAMNSYTRLAANKAVVVPGVS
jgi:regulator of protease activity HflC (stomatin/prohibitin superfamily)